MKVAIYCRVSTDKQELDAQLAACKQYSAARGFEVVKTFAEIGSGKSFERKEWQECIKLARQRSIDGIVCFRWDRVGRNARETVLFFEEMEKIGCQIISINENIDTSTAIGRFARDIILRLAELEREQISEATKHRLNALRNLGKRLGRKPVALDLDKVRELRAQGKGWRKIAMILKCPQATIRGQIQRAEKVVVKSGAENADTNGGSADSAVSCTPKGGRWIIEK